MSNIQGRRLLFSPGRPVVEESWEVPAPTGAQVLVEISHSAISAGSEQNFLRHGPHGYGIPENPEGRYHIGYMAAGRVAALGPQAAGWAVGDHVICGATHGSHWIADPARANGWLLPVPDGVDPAHAPFAVLGDVALHGVRRAQLVLDHSAAVFGMGIVGQLTLQLARIAGAHPRIAVDLDDARLKIAADCGATHVINASREDAIARIKAITGAGTEVTFHCTAAAAMLPDLLRVTATRGRVVLTGSAAGVAPLTLQDDLLRREVSLVGVYEVGLDVPHAYWPWSRERNRRACLRWMSEGALQLAPLVSHVVPAGEADAAYQRMLAGPSGWLGQVIRWR